MGVDKIKRGIDPIDEIYEVQEYKKPPAYVLFKRMKYLADRALKASKPLERVYERSLQFGKSVRDEDLNRTENRKARLFKHFKKNISNQTWSSIRNNMPLYFV